MKTAAEVHADDVRHRRRRQIRSMFLAAARHGEHDMELLVDGKVTRCPPSLRGVVLRPGILAAARRG